MQRWVDVPLATPSLANQERYPSAFGNSMWPKGCFGKKNASERRGVNLPSFISSLLHQTFHLVLWTQQRSKVIQEIRAVMNVTKCTPMTSVTCYMHTHNSENGDEFRCTCWGKVDVSQACMEIARLMVWLWLYAGADSMDNLEWVKVEGAINFNPSASHYPLRLLCAEKIGSEPGVYINLLVFPM